MADIATEEQAMKHKVTEHGWVNGLLNEWVTWFESEEAALAHAARSAMDVKVHDDRGVIIHQSKSKPQETYA
jgi:hypothetical protein